MNGAVYLGARSDLITATIAVTRAMAALHGLAHRLAIAGGTRPAHVGGLGLVETSVLSRPTRRLRDRWTAVRARLAASYKLQAARTWIEATSCRPAAFALRRRAPGGIWLFCERGDTAEDNAFHLFRHVRERHPDQTVCFVATLPRQNPVAPLGRVVGHGSRAHKIWYLAATHLVSTHARGMIEPWPVDHAYAHVPRPYREKRFVFLEHGVTKEDNSDTFGAAVASGGFDIYCTVSDRQAAFVRDVFSYPDRVVQTTGLARYDALRSATPSRRVLFAPTWRSGVVQPSWDHAATVDRDSFLRSPYYAAVEGVLRNHELRRTLREHGRTLVFYPHYEVQQYIDLFTTSGPGLDDLVVAHTVHTARLQDLMLDAELLVTDYSSIAFDMAYLGRPVVYYQFDEAYYYEHHYRRGYFDHRRDGFGPVVTTPDALVDAVRAVLDRDGRVGAPYDARAERFFRHRDAHNCERILAAIRALDAPDPDLVDT